MPPDICKAVSVRTVACFGEQGTGKDEHVSLGQLSLGFIWSGQCDSYLFLEVCFPQLYDLKKSEPKLIGLRESWKTNTHSLLCA